MPRPTTRLFLIRHGEVDANIEFRFLGRRDDPLNETGVRQAECLASLFAALSIDVVYSSPKDRTSTTAHGIAEASGADLHFDDRLLELDFGSWEGLTRKQIIDSDPGFEELIKKWDRDPSTPAPGGEALTTVQARVLRFADEMPTLHPGETIAVVSHMGPIKSLLCAALELPLTGARRLFLDPATVSVVDWSTRPIVRLVNSHAHLGWTNARWLKRGPPG
jgi:broad specificity phosphatase PhoE